MSLLLEDIEIRYRATLRSLVIEYEVTDDNRVLVHHAITLGEGDDLNELNLRMMLPDTVIQQFMKETDKTRYAVVEETIVDYVGDVSEPTESITTEEHNLTDTQEVEDEELHDLTPVSDTTNSNGFACADSVPPDFKQRLLTHQIHTLAHPEETEGLTLQKFVKRVGSCGVSDPRCSTSNRYTITIPSASIPALLRHTPDSEYAVPEWQTDLAFRTLEGSNPGPYSGTQSGSEETPTQTRVRRLGGSGRRGLPRSHTRRVLTSSVPEMASTLMAIHLTIEDNHSGAAT